jgi:hypothetical protein
MPGLSRSFLALSLASIAACSPDAAAPPDAAPPSTIPTSPQGTFTIASELDLAVPAIAEPVLASLTAATDGPDDPARFLVDHMVACLPDGPVRAVAAGAAPYVAAYLNARLAELAPRLRPGMVALSAGLTRIASHLGTLEALRVGAGGDATRTITAIRFTVGSQATTVRLADSGIADLAATAHVTLDATGRVAIAAHSHALPYGAILRLGLARAVIPSVEPTAHDLAQALAALVDCARIGGLIAERVGLGPAGLYDAACRTAMTAVASEVDARIAAIDQAPISLRVSGQAQGLDRDADGVMDELRAGSWTGALDAAGASAPLRAGSFAATTP